jgi:regulator of sigma E protease
VRMRPRRFYIFFPPPLVKRVHNGIEYGIGTIPLGGYVKIPGMHRPAARDLEIHFEGVVEEAPWMARHVEPLKESLEADRLDEARALVPELRDAVARAELSEPMRRRAERAVTDVDDGLSRDAYWRAPVWKRVAVIVAGPGTNLVFAIALLALVFMLGVPEVTRTVARIDAAKPAARVLEPGDRLVAIGGSAVKANEIAEEIRSSRGRPLRITVVRDGQQRTFTVSARRDEDGEYRLGFALGAVEKEYGPIEATGLAADRTWEVTKLIGEALGRIVTGSGRDEVGSVVGIVQVSSEALEFGVQDFLGVLALISLSLALLNMLPLLPLDGGHIAFSIAEGIRGRAIAREAYERVSIVGITLVLLLFFLGLSNDIDRLRGG